MLADMLKMATALLSSDELAMAREWFGYGSWDAPYWFVGIEPGGDALGECVRLWHRLGKAELLDIAAHHEEHSQDWFGPRAAPQKTWQKLIWLLKAYKGLEATPKATLDYQKHELGRIGGETALPELSALPAHNNRVPVERGLFREERIAKLRARMIEHKPRFVVFYSPDPQYRNAWNAIAGRELVRDEPVDVDGTTCLVTYHPNGKWAKDYWIEMGTRLRSFSRAASAANLP